MQGRGRWRHCLRGSRVIDGCRVDDDDDDDDNQKQGIYFFRFQIILTSSDLRPALFTVGAGCCRHGDNVTGS